MATASIDKLAVVVLVDGCACGVFGDVLKPRIRLHLSAEARVAQLAFIAARLIVIQSVPAAHGEIAPPTR
jgi:hypothetical protein